MRTARTSNAAASRAGCVPRNFALAVAIVMGAAWADTPQAAARAASEYEIKAAYLYQFSRFVQWPDSAFAGASLVLGIAGHDPFGPAIDRLLSGKRTHGRPITVVRLLGARDVGRCHLVFVGDSDPKLALEVLTAAGDAPVLTVGESERFEQAGGMIRFKSVGGRVRFDVREDVAAGHGLHLSSDLLRAADRVRRRTP